MARTDRVSEGLRRLANRIQARRSAFARPATGFVSQPEPRTLGSFARGRQLCAGNYLFAGFLVEARGTDIWDLPVPDSSFEAELHGFSWLDDLAAVGDAPARRNAQNWLNTWVERFGPGRGPGWTPDLTGRRLIRWINHALFLLNGQDAASSERYYLSLGQQVLFLSRRWPAAAAGLPRFEALTGLIYAGLALTGMDHVVAPATEALARECAERIDQGGGIPSRNPEELLEVFSLLTWAASALAEAGQIASAEHKAALERIAPTLRLLRHSDGGLARFHGGGRGAEGRLDHALAASGIRPDQSFAPAMGYIRLQAGRTSVVLDAAAPPEGLFGLNAHASTFAFELTSGRRPLIVNCGSGAAFGEDWKRAGRATPSHSTLGAGGLSLARLARAPGRVRGEILTDAPRDVICEQNQGGGGLNFHGGHDGYRRALGLTHVRKLDLSHDGRALIGEDTLTTLNEADQETFDRALDKSSLQGVAFEVRFHVHPDVDVALDMAGTAVSLALRSGEIWVFRYAGALEMTIEPSVYLEKHRLKPRATKQIVLSGVMMEYAARVSWTLAKAQDTPDAIRDLEIRDPDATNP